MKNGFLKTKEQLEKAIAAAYDRWYEAMEKHGRYEPETKEAWAEYEGLCKRLNQKLEHQRRKDELAEYIRTQQELERRGEAIPESMGI